MKQLEIAAEIEYVRPLPYYLSADCRQLVMGYVHGHCQPLDEFRGLESFRQAVIKLAREGLDHPPDCEPDEEPFVRVKLTTDADGAGPMPRFEVSLGWYPSDRGQCWELCWRRAEDKDDEQMSFAEVEHALEAMKMLLDKETGQWASQVTFQNARVDS